MTQLGRPTDPARTQAIYAAARELVLKKGITGLSMEGIAKSAGVSKVTLYRRFGDLAGLVQQYVNYHLEQAISHQTQHTPDRVRNKQNIEHTLSQFGVRVMRLISSRDVILFDNAVCASWQRYPDVGKSLFRAGPTAVLNELAEIIEQGVSDLPVTLTPMQAAESLFSLWKSGFYDELRMTGHMSFSEDELQRHVQQQTQLFLALFSHKK